MNAIEQRHQEAVEQLTARYRKDGFIVENGDEFGADLIARRATETVLIEAKLFNDRAAPRDLGRLAELAQKNGWKFVVAVVDARDLEEVEIKSATEIGAKLSEARQLGNASTAFPLLAWSVFEAAARNALARGNQRFPGATPPQRLIQLLASLGLVDTSEERELLALAHHRNRVAHGLWPEGNGPESPDFDRVLTIAERLVTIDELGPQATAG